METTVVAIDACAWPVLVRLSHARLGLVYFNKPSHGLEEGDLVAVVSDDDGRSWTPAGTVAPHDPGANRMHLASGLDHAGNWMVLSSGLQVVNGQHRGLDPVWCSTAEPGTTNWSVRHEVAVIGASNRVIPHGRILALPDGRLAATFYRSMGRGQPSHAWIAFSSDRGATWVDASVIGGGDANEVVLLRQGGDTLLAATRTHVDHHVALHVSNDAGATWRFRCDLTLPMQHPADLLDLGERGILFTYGIRNRGLMGIGARLSRDGGVTWSAPVVLTQFGDATDCGYPSTQLCADGGLLTACYSDLSACHRGYHLLTLRWSFDEFFVPRGLRSISDGGPLKA